MTTERAAIAGVAETAFAPPAPLRSGEQLTLEAVVAAAADAGISVKDIDGICKYSYDGCVSDVDLARTLGLGDVRFSVEVPHGGGSCGSLIQAAAVAVRSGIANHVVCYRTVVAHQWFAQMAGPDRGRPYYFDAKRYLRPHGIRSYVDAFALLFAEHAARYGTRREHLGALAIAARVQASRHDNALLTNPLTLDEYLAAPPVSGELSALDDLVQVDGSVAVVVTSERRAADLAGAAVPVLAVADAGGAAAGGYWELAPLRSEPFETMAGRVAARLYKQAGITPHDVDVALLYDCTTVAELQLLEEYNLIQRGGVDAVLEPGFGDSVLPINTHGGHLAGGYLHGFSHVAEGIRQMRGTAANQVPGAQIALIGGPPMAATSGLVLGKAAA